MASVEAVVDSFQPAAIVNCVGVVKQLDAGKDPLTCISINSLFPHQLADLCNRKGIHLICISTDCVFSGQRGGYAETDVSDAADLYGRTKFLGEVDREGSLTLRTSIIGREFAGAHGLVEWFLSQEGKSIRGFSKAIFSGVTTRVLADTIRQLICQHPRLHGVYHVAARPIAKYDLLTLVRDVYDLDITIETDDTFACDRSLDGSKFESASGITIPSWQEMIQGMHDDPTPYDEIRAKLAQGH
jgi:dTDP-4-dehydrorhamnose reductase